MIIESLLTFIVFILFFFFFPDNPTTAYFLTEEEKIIAVKRVQGNQNGIETKVWKKYQCVDSFPVSYMLSSPVLRSRRSEPDHITASLTLDSSKP